VETKRRKGCCGCLVIILVIALILTAWWVIVHSGLLETLGLRQSAAERLFTPPPDREAAEALMSMLQQGGMDMQGVSIHVLPMSGKDGSVAIVTMDASQGLDLEQLFGGDGNGMDDVFDPDTLNDLNITRLAFDYVDDTGKSIVTLTVPTQVLESSDEMNEKDFLRAVMGRIDIPGLVREVTK
jgi:hypothetical protein